MSTFRPTGWSHLASRLTSHHTSLTSRITSHITHITHHITHHFSRHSHPISHHSSHTSHLTSHLISLTTSHQHLVMVMLERHFSWQVQHLVMLECDFWWQGQHLVMLECRFSRQAWHLNTCHHTDTPRKHNQPPPKRHHQPERPKAKAGAHKNLGLNIALVGRRLHILQAHSFFGVKFFPFWNFRPRLARLYLYFLFFFEPGWEWGKMFVVTVVQASCTSSWTPLFCPFSSSIRISYTNSLGSVLLGRNSWPGWHLGMFLQAAGDRRLHPWKFFPSPFSWQKMDWEKLWV